MIRKVSRVSFDKNLPRVQPSLLGSDRGQADQCTVQCRKERVMQQQVNWMDAIGPIGTLAVFLAIFVAIIVAKIRQHIKVRRINAMMQELTFCNLKQVHETCEAAGLRLFGWRYIFDKADPFLLGQTCGSLLKFEETGGKEAEDAEIIKMLEQIDRGEQPALQPNPFKTTVMEEWFKTLAIHICGKKEPWIKSFLAGVGKNHGDYSMPLINALNAVRSKKVTEKMLAERKKKLRQGIHAAVGNKKPTEGVHDPDWQKF